MSFAVPEAMSLHVEALGAGRRNLILSEGASPWGSPARTLRAVDPASGAEIWRSPPIPGSVPVNSLSYADADGDGDLELVFATEAGMFVSR